MHTTRRTWITALAAAVTGGLVLSACSGGDADAEGGDSSGPTTLTIANWQFNDTEKGRTLWAAIEDYSGPDENITLENVGSAFGNYADRLNTMLGAGEGPDVMIMLEAQAHELADAGLLEPLDDIAEEMGDSLNGTNESGVILDQQYGFNWERPTYNTMIYNQDVLDAVGAEVPTTYDEFIDVSETIRDSQDAFDLPQEVFGFAGRHQTNELNGWILEMANWIYGHGGELSDGSELTIASDANVAAVQAHLDLFASGVPPLGDDASTFRAKFGQGQIGMSFENSGVATTMATDPDNVIDGTNLGAAPLPLPNPGGHSQLLITVNADSENVEAAKDFIRWFLTDEAQEAIRLGHGASALATDVPLDPEFAEANPWAEQFIESASDSRSTLVAGFELDSVMIWREFLTAVEELRINGGDIRESLEQVQETVEAELGR
ncbi:ABC transporter substrate-binding protein [Ruania rhizosphaerae]|uniref:ABC transporter substrate-binding protein n=1 Tax=Ruania rhizosphaerae TaxID=1840413 RepID=UPI001358F53B|nr:extracellular solute-binding protein [Ruania rhizosphaerae]